METGLTYGQAIKSLLNGKRVAREGWNGKGLFVFMQIPSEIDVKSIVPNMQSLPDSVKKEFEKRYNSLYYQGMTPPHDDPHLTIRYRNQFAIVKPDNEINSWVASSSDTLATDWCVLPD